MKHKVELDWNNQYLKRWLDNRKESTVENYRIGITHYVRFTGLTPDEMIQEKYEDLKKPNMEQGIVEDRVKAFYNYLRFEYKSRFKKEKGLAPNSALAYVTAVADFYSTFKMKLDLVWDRDFPASTLGKNETEKMVAEQVDSLANLAPDVKYKAVIWIMFQSGIDVSQVCSLTWGQVEKELQNPPIVDDYPTVMLRGLLRAKEPWGTFNTLFGKTAIHYLRLSLEKTYGKDYASKLKYESPLFLGRTVDPKKRRQLRPRYVQETLRKIAPDSGILGTRFEAADFNPISPRSLRASFSDRMAKAGASQILVDYLQGHKMKYGTAYFGGEEGLRESYVKYAKIVLEPQRVKGSVEVQADISRQNKIIEGLNVQINDLVADKAELEEKVREQVVLISKVVKFQREVVLPFIERASQERDDLEADFLDACEIAREELKREGEEK